MIKCDMKDFLRLLNTLGTLYEKALPPVLIELYWQALEHYPLHTIHQALNQHVRDKHRGRFFPTPADVLSYLQGDDEAKAIKAWNVVVKTISRVGAYGSVKFEDPLIAYVLQEMGGWLHLCRSQESDLPFKQREFCQKYQHYLKRPPALNAQSTAGFRGILECRNGLLLEHECVISIPSQNLITKTEEQ
ncbi:MAG: hypothetical protein K0R24_1109 [Gammaproteobacteria bacterium]|jgi:hypothetical protein|nr:hypothetical protein [Gammaproteobacteria bacterium]